MIDLGSVAGGVCMQYGAVRIWSLGLSCECEGVIEWGCLRVGWVL